MTKKPTRVNTGRLHQEQPEFPTQNPDMTFRPEKIVSGGQTGVDRAGLEMAIALGIAHGGWCPRGRLAEDGTVPTRFQLVENDSRDYAVRTRRNVIDSDATLILYEDRLRGGSLLTRRVASEVKKPCLCLKIPGMSGPSSFEQAALIPGAASSRDPFHKAIEKLHRWLDEHRPQVLNIAGPRESSSRGIFERSLAFLIEAFKPGT